MQAETESGRVIPAVGTVCFKNDDVLLIRRGKAPFLDDWSLPGGRIEAGEHAGDAALRELREETGIEAQLIGLVDVVDGIFTSSTTETPHHYLLFDYAARWISGDPVAADDAVHAEWISPDRLTNLGLWSEIFKIIQAARQMAGPC